MCFGEAPSAVSASAGTRAVTQGARAVLLRWLCLFPLIPYWILSDCGGQLWLQEPTAAPWQHYHMSGMHRTVRCLHVSIARRRAAVQYQRPSGSWLCNLDKSVLLHVLPCVTGTPAGGGGVFGLRLAMFCPHVHDATNISTAS